MLIRVENSLERLEVRNVRLEVTAHLSHDTAVVWSRKLIQKLMEMKNLKLRGILFVLIITISSICNSQVDTNGIWVTINQPKDIPTMVEGKLRSTNNDIQQLINDFNIIEVEQAVPASRRESLLKVYEFQCICDQDKFLEAAALTRGLINPERAPEYELLMTPNDYSIAFSNDYALNLINAQTAWDYTVGDTNIILGISDGGYYENHEELVNEYVSVYNYPNAPAQYKNHGTAVATAAAGGTDNGVGKSSIGNQCKLALTTMNYNKLLTLSNNGARVVNASWAGSCWYSQYIQNIIDEIYDNGTIIVAAAGNGGTCGGAMNKVYPASFNHVIAVSSIGPNDNHERTIGNPATTHQHNDSVDICAPGYDVPLAVAPGWYLIGNGTSFAAPIVTGTIGLMLSLRPCLTFEEVEAILKATAVKIDSLNPNYAGLLGAGRLDAGAALAYVASIPQLNVEIGPQQAAVCSNSVTTLTATPSNGTGPYQFSWSSTADSTINGISTQSIDVTVPGDYFVAVTDSKGCMYAYDTIQVVDYSNDALVSAGQDMTICSDPVPAVQLTGSAPITGSAIWTNYTGTFNTNESDTIAIYTPSQSEIQAGQAELWLVSQNNLNCPADTDYIIINLTTFDASITSVNKNVTCNGMADGLIDLTVTGSYAPFSFNWSNASSSEDLDNLGPGSYNVVVTDSVGCTASYTTSIIEPDPLVVSDTVISIFNGNNVSCYNSEDGSIDINVIGGTAPYQYIWSSSNTYLTTNNTQDLSLIPAGQYKVIVTDSNGCTLEETYDLTQPSELNVILSSTLYPSGNNISCNGFSDGAIDLEITGGTQNYSYNWTTLNGSGLVSINEDQQGLSGGLYSVAVTDANGCTISDSIVLTEPDSLEVLNSVSIFNSGNNISCTGLDDGTIDVTVNGGSSGYAYLWTTLDGSGLNNGNEDQTGLSAGTYNLTVEDINGCMTSTVITLTEPDSLIVNINVLSDYYGNAVSCTGNKDGEIEASVIGGSPGYTINWSSNQGINGYTLTNLGEGTYTINVTDTNGCVNSAFVTLEGNPLPNANPDAPISVCEGEPITINSNGNSSESCLWQLNNGMLLNDCGPSTFYIQSPGCYDATLIVTNEFQCADTLTIEDYICVIANPVAQFNYINNEVTILNPEVEFINESVGAVTYEWNFGDNATSSDLNPIHLFPEEAGIYQVTLTAFNEQGCENTTQLDVNILDELLFYVPNSFTPNGDEYNNSFKPVFGSGFDHENYQLMIYNRWGQVVFESSNLNVGWDGTTQNGDPAQDGTYTWSMKLQASTNTVERGKPEMYHGHVSIIR